MMAGLWARDNRARLSHTDNPFAVLGLDPAADVTGDDVRAAWRRIAAATHPDRADGGNPGLFAAAAAAYTELRTPFGRNEARAAIPARPRRPVSPGGAARLRGQFTPAAVRLLARAGQKLRSGRPVRLVLRVAASGVAAAAAVLAAGPGPAAPALVTGALTWL